MVTIKINERTKAGKTLLEVARLFSEEDKEVMIIEDSPYDPEFVAEIKAREERSRGKELTRVDPDDVWGSIL